jgi:hypothetical protein
VRSTRRAVPAIDYRPFTTPIPKLDCDKALVGEWRSFDGVVMPPNELGFKPRVLCTKIFIIILK